MTTLEELLTVVDRAVAPVIERMGRMEHKLDEALQIKEDVAVSQAAQTRTDARLLSLEDADRIKAIQLAKAEGRNTVINWILGLIGAPLVVGIAIAGIVKVLGLG